MIDLLIWSSAVTCLPISLWDGVSAEDKDSHYGTVVNYTCDDDRRFPDGSTIKTTRCMIDGNWSPGVVSCPGKENSPLTVLWRD